MRAFQPLSEAIQAVEIPHQFWEPVIRAYNGTGDPQSHVDAVQNQMFISGDNDVISCKMLVDTLTEVALKCLKGVPPRSVVGFEDLAT